MTPERWQLTQDLVEEALALFGAERESFLARSCDGDGALRDEVESLLVIDTKLGDFIEKPLFDVHSDHGSLAAGDTLGAWRIVGEVGRGGMGAVYLAERADASFEKKAAIKLLKRGMDTDELVRRFRSERRILARLDHPHIARLLDGGSTADGRPYLVMEYIEGRPIDAWCTEQALSVEDRLILFEKVCRAVHFAHRNLVVHRDLKPGNILVVADGEPRLLDFGIAKLLEGDPEPFATVAAFLPMTPEYASPEQIRGEPVTTATDVYSLGVLLYRLLAGRSPYRPATEGRASLAEAVCNQEPQRPSTVVGSRAKAAAETAGSAVERDRHLAKRLRGDLDTIVQKALRKEPGRRYESAEQLAADVRRHLDGLPVLARASGVGYRTRKFVGRHKIGVTLATGALLAIISSAAWALIERAATLREKNRAEAQEERATWSWDFMTEVFQVNDPSVSKGRDLTAIELLDRARTKLETSGEQPAQSSQHCATLGTVYMQLGKFETAKKLFRRALELQGRAKIFDGPQKAEALLGLAQVENELGHSEQAEKLMKRGFAVFEDAKGDKGAEYVKALNNYGGLLVNTQRPVEAETQFRRALAVKQEPGRGRDRTFAIALAGLGECKLKQNQLSEAEAYFRQSLDFRRRVFGEPSIEVATTLNSLSSVLDDLQKYDEARSFYISSIDMRREVLGPSHPKLAPPLSNLARLNEKMGRWGEVEVLYREAVSICQKSGNEDRNCGIFISHLASFLSDRRGCEEAEPMAQKALSLLEVKGGTPESVAESQGVLGGCLTERKDFKSAEPLLLQALGGLPERPTPLVERRIRERLVRLYEATGRPAEAAKYRQAPAKPTA